MFGKRKDGHGKAYKRYLTFLDQPIVIIDRLNQVVMKNDAFSAMFPRVETGETLHAFLSQYPVLERLLALEEGQHALIHNGRHYGVHVSRVRRGRRRQAIAKVWLFTDDTDLFFLMRQTERQSEEIARSNERILAQNSELEENIRLERQAAVLRAHTQLLRDIHDMLGHTLVILGELHAQAAKVLPDVEEARIWLEEIWRWIGVSSAELESAGDYSTGSFVQFLHRFKASMMRVGLEIRLEIEGEELPVHQYMYADLVRVCQEAATNAIKHGHATELEIVFRMGVEDVSLRISDNGQAGQQLGSGHGLVGMEERANSLFGDFSYGWKADGGFWVAIDAPIIREDEETAML